ncbi:MAG: hypothetical protein ABIR55_11945 [Burkholderiaceae bacterium]
MSGLLAAAEPVERALPIAVIVAPGHVGVLRSSDLSLIYMRKKLFWPKGDRINPVNLPASHRLRQAFSRWVLGESPEEMELYWNDMYFHGTSPPFVLGSPEAVLRFVAQTPGAVGYLSYCDVDARVKVALVLSENGPVSEDAARQACAR